MLVGARRLELLDRDLVVLVGAGEHLDGDAVGQRDGLGVRRPVRRGQQHLVAGVHHGLERLIHGLLAAVGHDDLRRVDLEAGVAQRLGRDRLAQHRQTDGRGVAEVRGVAQGLGCGIHDRTAASRSRARRPRNEITGRPAACSALALASTLRVADSAIALSLWESVGLRGIGARSVTPSSVAGQRGRRRADCGLAIFELNDGCRGRAGPRHPSSLQPNWFIVLCAPPALRAASPAKYSLWVSPMSLPAMFWCLTVAIPPRISRRWTPLT